MKIIHGILAFICAKPDVHSTTKLGHLGAHPSNIFTPAIMMNLKETNAMKGPVLITGRNRGVGKISAIKCFSERHQTCLTVRGESSFSELSSEFSDTDHLSIASGDKLMPQIPDPNVIHPLNGFERVCFIKNTVKSPNIEIGDYTYYDDPDDSENFERNVLYHYDFVGDKLIIGKFCALASGVTFIMNGANHRMDTLSTFPFAIFGCDWAKNLEGEALGEKSKGNTVVGHDVWLGYDVTVMPGVSIGSGSIIASKSVVVSDVEPYSIYGGNPARKIKSRFSEEVIRELLLIRWWDWPHDLLTEHVKQIYNNDINELRAVFEKIKTDL